MVHVNNHACFMTPQKLEITPVFVDAVKSTDKLNF